MRRGWGPCLWPSVHDSWGVPYSLGSPNSLDSQTFRGLESVPDALFTQ